MAEARPNPSEKGNRLGQICPETVTFLTWSMFEACLFYRDISWGIGATGDRPLSHLVRSVVQNRGVARLGVGRFEGLQVLDDILHLLA